MIAAIRHLRLLGLGLLLTIAAGAASAQNFGDSAPDLQLPGIQSYAPPTIDIPLAVAGTGQLTVSAHLIDGAPAIDRGLVWRVFHAEQGPDGRLPLVATAQGGTGVFDLEPGSYLVHAAFGRAGATKRIKVGNGMAAESLVLEAGGLKLDAVLSGGVRIPPNRLSFSIYEANAEVNGERALILPDVDPNTVIRLNAGVYHVVSTYGNVNAVIRSDIRVEAGKLTEATVEHKAAEVTLKLVRESGGEAIADTSWAILTESGDIVRESVGAFASLVLAAGNYAVVAKNRDRIYQKDFTVVAGRNRDVEVLATETEAAAGQLR
jgi:hypothetical protein